ncbi:MAG: hypothetical protein WC376_02190 [Candidatus Nanoarchaeia archaeon]|jgi:hypothetical protein
MVVELSDLAKEYKPVFIVSTKNEDFNTKLIEILEEYTLAVVDCIKHYRD